jgi:hypothetical protein
MNLLFNLAISVASAGFCFRPADIGCFAGSVAGLPAARVGVIAFAAARTFRKTWL